ncbi:A disintegrin and metalloproteinase with thrombospondin motifs 3 [Halotydeus destructor]|nr:A disintegrin and metalloproteinase with thrombospondin motifs 3 [Halotydeus destructor]
MKLDLLISFLLFKVTASWDSYTFQTLTEVGHEKVVKLCHQKLAFAKLSLTPCLDQSNLVQAGIHYTGNSSCLYSGYSKKGQLVVAIDMCDEKPKGFVNFKGVIKSVMRDNICKDSVGSGFERQRLKRSASQEESFCGNAFDEKPVDESLDEVVKVMRQKGQLPLDYGNLTLPVAIFYDSGFKLKFATEETLNRNLAGMVAVMRATYAQKVFHTVANLSLIVTHVAEMPSVSMTERNSNNLLTDFALAQNNVRISLKSSGVSWAAAILVLSGNFEFQGKSKVTGLANLAKICNDPRNAAGIVEGRTFISAYVAAHELGHILAMDHDGGPKNQACDGAGHIMSDSVGSGKVTFSECSVNNLRRKLDIEYVNNTARFDECFRSQGHQPAPAIKQWLTQMPGHTVDAKAQCTFGFGPAYEVDYAATQEGICPMMFCKHNFWRVQSGPALPGTLCQSTADGQQFRCDEEAHCVLA